MKINEKIYSLRKKNNMSQEELADKLNVSRQTVSKWEVGDSTPDFDKIVPLCDVFGITTDELLTDKVIDKEGNIIVEEKPDPIRALLISGAVFLYFLAIVSIVFGEEYLQLSGGILVSIFFIICGLATALIIFTCMTRPRKHKRIEEDNRDPLLRNIISCTSLVFTCIYLFVSFKTMAWHMTWIIWIIFAIVVKIIELVYSLKKENKKDE